MNRGWVDNLVEVNVHNAPLDSTISLMAEMEKKALEKILSSTRLENSIIHCVIHELYDPLKLQRKFLIRLKINGKILGIEHISGYLDDEKLKEEIIKKSRVRKKA